MPAVGTPMLEVLVLVFIVALVWAAMRDARLQRERLQQSFADVVVQTPQGPVRCGALRVVKDVEYHARSSEGSSRLQDVFRYCVGPGPSYFLVIGQMVPHGWRGRLEWVVRPLDEARMRAALQGDATALAAAFGDAATQPAS